MKKGFVFLLIYLFLFQTEATAKLPDGVKVFKDIRYVKDGHEREKLDLYLPANPENKALPLVIWIHGGGWQKGSKDKIERNAFILEQGFALASIDYRLSSDAVFPAQIHDCKAAIRYLRRNAHVFQLDANNFGVWGASAGGHLAALVGTTIGDNALDGNLGFANVSTKVNAVCNWFGPTDLVKMNEIYVNKGLSEEELLKRPGAKFIGGLVNENLEKTKQASPINHVSSNDVPFLIMHGDADALVPLSESENLHNELRKVNVKSELIVVPGAPHGFFKTPELHQKVVAFFIDQLKSEQKQQPVDATKKLESPFLSNWAVRLPDGETAWLSINDNNGKIAGELWMKGAPKPLTEMELQNNKLLFTHKRAVGEPKYVGGAPTGAKIPIKHSATLNADKMEIIMQKPLANGKFGKVVFWAKRIPPLPEKPDLSRVEFGDPIELFNGKNLDGWRLTNPKQTNCWKVVDGVLFNDTPKKNFDAFAQFGNLRTDREFTDFNLKIDFNVPKDGNSGIYLRGLYEAQVVDRDSRMQGLHGVGAIFNRILPKGNYGKPGGEWQHYDITLVDRHVTVILNGVKVIDNAPLEGCTNGALTADESLPGPLYLQGDHTSVKYRNIVLTPVIPN